MQEGSVSVDREILFLHNNRKLKNIPTAVQADLN